MKNTNKRSKATEIAITEWRSRLTGVTAAILLFEILSGLSLYFLPFSQFNQFGLLLHTVIGMLMLLPVIWYCIQHWKKRYGGNFNHFQLLGYLSVFLLLISVISGLVVTYEGLFKPQLSESWDVVHLICSLLFSAFIILHLTTLIFRKVGKHGPDQGLVSARVRFYIFSIVGCGLIFVPLLLAQWSYQEHPSEKGFSDNYNWRYGEDRPFAPSFAKIEDSEWQNKLRNKIANHLPESDRKTFESRLDELKAPDTGYFTKVRQSLKGLDAPQESLLQTFFNESSEEIKSQGALTAKSLAGSKSCGSSNCHSEIYEEWLPSAHRYSSMDDMFQKVQSLMLEETSAEHTRYCAGCHDPISLFSGSKNQENITLSVEGADEGASCVVCHSIVKTDVQGNGNYELKVPQRYVFELTEGDLAKMTSDFLIRTYPQHHTASYARSLYKTPEYCAACHKQYLDVEVNTDIGKVQGQNQYDNWKNSRWFKDKLEDSTTCRECHMPLVASTDPASGDTVDYNRSADDRRHRSHRTLGTNQYIPELHKLKGAKEHTELTVKWMRGEIAVPEIANKWVSGPAVILMVHGSQDVMAGGNAELQVQIMNNKAGHDFPTGPMDMIQSWVEVTALNEAGEVIYRGGYLDEDGFVQGLPVLYRADGFDREGELIDRHNLWDLVGASYKRTLYPGMSDNVKIEFPVPEDLRDGETITVEAKLNYRKANPEFLDQVYGKEQKVRTPVTSISETTYQLKVSAARSETVEPADE